MTFLALLRDEPSERLSRKAVISRYKWMGVECPKKWNYEKAWKIVLLHQPCSTGGGPLGAARRAARHNTGKVAGYACLSPIGQLNTKQENKANPHNSQLRSYVNRGQGPSLSKCFVYPICVVRATLLEPTGQAAGRLYIHSANQPLRQTGPTSCSCQLDNLTWHYAGPPSQIIRNTRQQTPTMPLSPPSRFWGANWVLLRHDCHWKRKFDVGAEWCSSLSLRPWAVVQDSVSNTCLLFTDRFSTTTRSRGLETPALSCQD